MVFTSSAKCTCLKEVTLQYNSTDSYKYTVYKILILIDFTALAYFSNPENMAKHWCASGKKEKVYFEKNIMRKSQLYIQYSQAEKCNNI